MSAFSSEQIEELKAIFASQPVQPAEPAGPVTPEDAEAARVAAVGKPDVDPEAGPEYYVHLANGDVVKSFDSASTHVNGQLVIGRYAVGE